MKLIGVYTKDFSLSHDIISRLKQRGIEFVHLHSLDRIPNRVGVIITSSLEGRDIKGKRIVFADCCRDIDSALDRAMDMLCGDDNEIVLGVDPGEYPGIALLSGKSILRTWCASSVDEALRIIKNVLDDFPHRKKIVRIGHDAKVYRDRLVEGLKGKNVEIEIVNEERTSQKGGLSRKERNELAAIRIARSRGESLIRKDDRGFTNGEIKEVQRKSRIVSGGRITISRELAIRVLEGKISIEEAVKLSKQ